MKPHSGVIRHSMSDHDICFSIQELSHAKQPKSEVYTRKIIDAKTKTFCELLDAADWSQVIATSEPDCAFFKFHLNLKDCYNKAFPLCNSSFNKRYNAINPWMSKGERMTVVVCPNTPLLSSLTSKRHLTQLTM